MARLYEWTLAHIARELKLPLLRCCGCGISYLPDYRSKNRQKYCPYGCVELNRRRNKQSAKNRYRKKQQAKLLASEYNRAYRVRKQNGCVCKAAETVETKQQLQRKITAQIKYFYKKLNPGAEPGKLKQLERILGKISQRMSSTGTYP